VLRQLPIAGFALVSLGLTGCGGGWDTLTSHRFRDGLLEHPYETVKQFYIPEDPMLVLRTEPPRDGDERAAAMHRLKEPIRNNGTQEDQDIIVNILAKAATSDPSPVIRMEAIGALGRFEDPRVVGALMVAYQNAHGRRGFDPPPPRTNPVTQTSGLSAGRSPTLLNSRELLDVTKSPNDYQPEWVTAIRCRAVDAIGKTGRLEGVQFLSSIAGGAGLDTAPEGSDDRDIRLAAVRGLGNCRHPESVVALVKVLNTATSVNPTVQDTAIVARTHDCLVRLTGKKLPAEPQEWNEVVQAGIVIAPEPGWWENTVIQVTGWVK
jgi:hypothetical protein